MVRVRVRVRVRVELANPNPNPNPDPNQALTPKMRAEAPALGPPLGVHSEQVLRGQSATLGEMTAQYHDVRCHLRRDPKVVGVRAS